MVPVRYDYAIIREQPNHWSHIELITMDIMVCTDDDLTGNNWYRDSYNK